MKQNETKEEKTPSPSPSRTATQSSAPALASGAAICTVVRAAVHAAACRSAMALRPSLPTGTADQTSALPPQKESHTIRPFLTKC